MNKTQKANAKIWRATFIIFTLLLFLSFVLFPIKALAICQPYPSCHFDINIDVRGYEPISGYLGLVDFTHIIDPKAPQLTTLIEGNCYPTITSLYQVYEWINDTRDGLYPRPPDLPGNFDFATLVGLSTQTGQAILVPDSGYDIGGGYKALVLYATSNQVTLQYTSYDGVGVPGYTIHLKNFNVDPALLDCYNQMDQAGRKELPAVLAGEKIGEASGGEILVATRDTGSFMDPRWKNDWWQRCVPTKGIDFVCKSISPSSPNPSPTPGPNPYPSLTCDPDFCTHDILGHCYKDSRPAECNICNFTNLKTPSCAESFTAKDNVSFYWREGQKCTTVTPKEYWVEKPWGGTVTVDPSKTTIPFVGKKGNESEKLYLADYFEGTNEYYKNYGEYWLDWVNYAGVLRKLTPMEYQNQMKEKMIERAVKTKVKDIHEGGVHDYNLKYEGRLCWDLPFLADLFLAIAKRYELDNIPAIKFISKNAHHCSYSSDFLPFSLNLRGIKAGIDLFNAIPLVPNISTWGHMDDENGTLTSLAGHFPPGPSEENYVEKWQAWKESKWGRLWEVVPMVSREDTPGDINPYLGARPKDTFILNSPEAQIEKVPHVARLYEASQEINKLMTPSPKSMGISQEKIGPIIASAEEKVFLAQKHQYSMEIAQEITSLEGGTYSCGLGEARPVNVCQLQAIADSNPNDHLCCKPIRINLTAKDSFNITDWYNECSKYPNAPGCNNSKSRDVSRQIGINLSHPYLYEIWNQTANNETGGIFNFFRPASVPQFSDVAASSQINYSYSGGSVEPSVGKFYFPYLGGVQLAKQWLIQALTPYVE